MQGSGFGDVGFWVRGSGFRVQGSGVRVSGLAGGVYRSLGNSR
jgi:hypothetical protein